MPINRQITLAARPHGMPDSSNFQLIETSLPPIKKGEVLIQILFFSVDPYMRGRMSDRPSYVAPFEIGKPLLADAVGRIVESNSELYKIGDLVQGMLEWADYSIAKADTLRKVDPETGPITLALGALGMPGMTAYFGLLDIGQPKAGETVVVSGAAGAVGMLVGQIAKLKGCRVVGIAGGKEKNAYLTKELGFDAAVDYKTSTFAEDLKKACPKGVDVYFDNVGGDVTDEVMKLINFHARIVVCGQISMYNLAKPDIGPRHFRQLITKSALAKGFLVRLDYIERYPEGIKTMGEWIHEGKIKTKESIVEGLERAPSAFLGLFKGANVGKQLVKI